MDELTLAGATPTAMHVIPAASYDEEQSAERHVFLVGNLQRPTTTPFVRDERVEYIVVRYDAADEQRPHWHEVVTEYELVTAGRLGCLDVATGVTHWFGPGDFITIPREVCVRRIVPDRAASVVVKVPSRSDKVHCASCARSCTHRLEPFSGAGA